jgi:hypothetical protein
MFIFITGKEKNGTMPIEIKYLETGRPQDDIIKNGDLLRGTYSYKNNIKINEIPRKIDYEVDENQVMKLLGDFFSIDFFEWEKYEECYIFEIIS